VRVRRIQGKGDDTVVKLRPVIPNELPEELRALPSFNVEVDAMPGGYVCSGSMKGALDAPRVRETVSGDRPLRKLSRRSSVPSTPRTRLRARRSTISRLSVRSSCSR
jgi:hypothetical protein